MLIATPSDQGLCLFLMIEEAGEEAGLGGCGWDSALRGAPSATAPLHSVEGGNGSGGMAALDRIITWGVSAEAVAQIDLVLTDGRTVHANMVEEPEGLDAPLNFYWAVLPVECPEYGCVDLDPVVHQIIALDATGEVLERRVVDEPKG